MIYRLILCLVFLGCYVHGQYILNTNLCSTINDNVTNCQDGDKMWTTPISYTDVIKVFDSNLTMETACTAEKSKYRDAGVCIVDSYRHCFDNDFKTLVYTSQKWGEAFDKVCDDLEAYKQILTCKSDSYEDCVRNKKARKKETGLSVTDEFSEFTKFYCGQITVEDECLADDIDVQKCLGGRLEKYQELQAILKPEACGASVIVLTTSLLVVSILLSLFH